MSLVATLIANPAAPILDTTVLHRACEALNAPATPLILSAGVAADIACAADAPALAVQDRLKQALAGYAVDVVVQEPAGRRKRLLLADMDSTMIEQECIDELADYAGVRAHVSAITERAMRGEIAFEPALRERVGLLEGLKASIVEEVIRERIRLTPGARALVATMRGQGAYAALVSGGFTAFTARIAAMIGFDENVANILGEEGGILTGTVIGPIVGRETKRERLLALRAERGLAEADTMAVGDGANDLDMLATAGIGVAYHAKPAVAAAARMRVDHGDLTALLYAQGYDATQIVGS